MSGLKEVDIPTPKNLSPGPALAENADGSAPSTDRLTGLTATEARRRLEQYGYNDPVKAQKTSRFVQFLLLFVEPLIAILLVASAVSARW